MNKRTNDNDPTILSTADVLSDFMEDLEIRAIASGMPRDEARRRFDGMRQASDIPNTNHEGN